MANKVIKFREHLIPLILSGEKTVTWRLFDDKDIQVGDVVDFVNWNTKEKFGEGFVLGVHEKELAKIEEKDWEGHEKFKTEEEMYENLRSYYGDRVNPETIVKIIKFTLKK